MLLGWHYSSYYSNAYALNQYLANKGFVVISVNYRLGIGYGYEFHNPIDGGTKGASEYKDIKAAGLWLKGQKDIDNNLLYISGIPHKKVINNNIVSQVVKLCNYFI